MEAPDSTPSEDFFPLSFHPQESRACSQLTHLSWGWNGVHRKQPFFRRAHSPVGKPDKRTGNDVCGHVRGALNSAWDVGKGSPRNSYLPPTCTVCRGVCTEWGSGGWGLSQERENTGTISGNERNPMRPRRGGGSKDVCVGGGVVVVQLSNPSCNFCSEH